MRPPFSRFTGGLRVGAEFFARRGARTSPTPAPRGLVERVADLSSPHVDVTRIHPAIVPFFEETVGLELLVRSRWRFPLSLLWPLFRQVMRAIGQLALPRREARVLTRAHGLDPARDGRADARAVLRVYADTGEVMQVIAYATWAHEGTRYMSASLPLPGGQIAGFLRLEANGDDDPGGCAVALSSKRRGDHAGIWFVVGPIAFRAPLGERLAFWGAKMRGVPGDLAPDALAGATIVSRHEQTLFGVRLVTHDYWFRPLPPPDTLPSS